MAAQQRSIWLSRYALNVPLTPVYKMGNVPDWFFITAFLSGNQASGIVHKLLYRISHLPSGSNGNNHSYHECPTIIKRRTADFAPCAYPVYRRGVKM